MKRGTITHPKTQHFADLLGVPLVQAVGHLEMLWHFTAQYAPSGDLGESTEEIVSQRCGWTGEPRKFIDALVNAKGVSEYGYLERTGNALRVHDWPQHCEDSVHMHLARAIRCFADGTRPKMSRLPQSERVEIVAKYEAKSTNAQQAHGERTAHARQTPCPPKPSPPRKTHKARSEGESNPPSDTQRGSLGAAISEMESAEMDEAAREILGDALMDCGKHVEHGPPPPIEADDDEAERERLAPIGSGTQIAQQIAIRNRDVKAYQEAKRE